MNTEPAPLTPMEAAMAVPTVNSTATGKTRQHRMMRRSEMVRRRREHTRHADLAAVELLCTPFWRVKKRMDLADLEQYHRDRAKWYAETLGETIPCL